MDITSLIAMLSAGTITNEQFEIAVKALNGATQEQPTNVGQAGSSNANECGRCSGKHQGRHLVDCPNKGEKPTNVGQTTAQPVVDANVLSRNEYILDKTKSNGNRSEKFSVALPEEATWGTFTFPIGKYKNRIKVIIENIE